MWLRGFDGIGNCFRLFSLSCGQFYQHFQHFMSTFAPKSLRRQKSSNFCMKKLCVKCCWNRSLCMVNFTNILCAHLCWYYCQTSSNLKCKNKKSVEQKFLYEKTARKMLVNMAPVFFFNQSYWWQILRLAALDIHFVGLNKMVSKFFRRCR